MEQIVSVLNKDSYFTGKMSKGIDLQYQSAMRFLKIEILKKD